MACLEYTTQIFNSMTKIVDIVCHWFSRTIEIIGDHITIVYIDEIHGTKCGILLTLTLNDTEVEYKYELKGDCDKKLLKDYI
jgi:hypothetical protein